MLMGVDKRVQFVGLEGITPTPPDHDLLLHSGLGTLTMYHFYTKSVIRHKRCYQTT